MSDSTYVPTYLDCVERGELGWPVGLPKAERMPLVEAVRKLLRERGPRRIADIDSWLQGEPSVRAGSPTWCHAALWDWRYAVVHRAIMEAGGCTMYGLDPSG